MPEAAAIPASADLHDHNDFYEEPLLDDDVEMILAYAALPLLDQVRDRILDRAAHYGMGVAITVGAGIDHVTQDVRGVRAFDTHPGVPYFSGYHEGGMAAVTSHAEEPREVLETSPELSLGGLIWPLPGGKWQYVDIMADGRVEPSKVMS